MFQASGGNSLEIRMPRIKCKGITTLIQKDPNAGIKYDKEKKFYAIPRTLANRYVKQASVPLLLEHNRKFTIGNVDNFYIEETCVDGEKREVLGAEFTIDNGSFIDVLQHVCAFRFKEIAPTDYISSDGFVKTEIVNSNAELDLTAHEAILQRLPGLSLGHDSESLDIVELSLCVAGARPGTVVTQAAYEVETDGSEVSKEEEDKEIYREFFAGLHAMSNGFRCKKVEADLKALDMPTTCLVYSKVGEGRKENGSITEDKTVENLPSTMEQPQQHHVPSNFSEQMRDMLESAFSRYLGTPQKPPITTSNWSTNVLPQGPTNYFANDRYRYHKRKKRYVADDFDDDDTFSESEEDDRSTQKRGRRTTNNKKYRRRVETSTTQDEFLQKQLDDVKEKLKVLVDNIPRKNDETPPPQKPSLTDHLGEMFDKKIKNAISDIQQTILQVPVAQQPEPPKSTQPEEAQKNTPSKNFSLKTDNYTIGKELTNAKEHLKAKLDDDSFMFGD